VVWRGVEILPRSLQIPNRPLWLDDWADDPVGFEKIYEELFAMRRVSPSAVVQKCMRLLGKIPVGSNPTVTGALHVLASICSLYKDPVSALEHGVKATTLLSDRQAPQYWVLATGAQGLAHHILGETSLGLPMVKSAYRFATERGMNRQALRVGGSLAFIYQNTGKCLEAINLYKLFLQRFDLSMDLDARLFCLNNLAAALCQIEGFEEAETYLETALAVIPREQLMLLATLLANMARVIASRGSTKGLQDMLEQVESIQRETKNGRFFATSLLNVGTAFMFCGQYDRAIAYFEQSAVIAKRHRHLASRQRAMKALAEAHHRTGDFDQSFEYLQRANELASLESRSDIRARVKSSLLIQRAELARRQADLLRNTNRELSRAKKVAEAATASKAEFLANMSHEIRTPMSGVIGLADLLTETPLDSTQREYANSIKSCGESLLVIINDILDFSKIEAEKLGVYAEELTISELVLQSSALWLESARTKGLWLNVDIEGRRAQRSLGDPIRIRQVVNNLLSNAVKFTQSGGVNVRLQIIDRGEDESLFRISIEDTGVGIPREKQDTIFESFTQADGSTSRRYGGTGLGLTLSKKLVELMGGSVGLRSELGVGSTFWFEIKLPNQEFVPARTAGPHPPLGLKILLAEDDRVNQLVAERLLERAGCTVCVAHNGLEALNLIQFEVVDAILMDCHMPDLDGYATARRIRELEKGGKSRIPIFALTATGTEEDRWKCLEAGMDDYLSKPIEFDRLFSLLQSLTQASSRAA
jgi:signal transduction histidine kinase/CheY-like chemotaxis protein